jgi:hypothetical protein
MPYTKTIICLANSRKYQGRCVAGLEWNGRAPGKWIRPVSGMDKGVLNYERFCGNSNGRDPRLLDLIRIEFLVPQPHAFQSENHRIDPCKRWTHCGSLKWQQLLPAVSRAKEPLWANAGSSKQGLLDVVPEHVAIAKQTSLILVQPERLTMTLSVDTSRFGEEKRRIRGEFCLAGLKYRLWVTDCAVEKDFSKRDDGEEKCLRDPILCISLGEVLESQRACYKLIAGVVATDR